MNATPAMPLLRYSAPTATADPDSAVSGWTGPDTLRDGPDWSVLDILQALPPDRGAHVDPTWGMPPFDLRGLLHNPWPPHPHRRRTTPVGGSRR